MVAGGAWNGTVEREVDQCFDQNATERIASDVVDAESGSSFSKRVQSSVPDKSIALNLVPRSRPPCQIHQPLVLAFLLLHSHVEQLVPIFSAIHPAEVRRDQITFSYTSSCSPGVWI